MLPSTANELVFAICAVLARVSDIAVLLSSNAISVPNAQSAAVISIAEMKE